MNYNRRAFIKQSFTLISGISLSSCGAGPGVGSPPGSPAEQSFSILIQPVDQSVSPGERADFQVTMQGAGPFTYQWRKNSVDIAGAWTFRYQTPALADTDDGAAYSVVVASQGSQISSREAKLTVLQSPPVNNPALTTVDSTNITIDSIQITIDGT